MTKISRAFQVAKRKSRLKAVPQISYAKLIAVAAGLCFSLVGNTGIAQDTQQPTRPRPEHHHAKTRLAATPAPILPTTFTPPPSAVLTPPSTPTAEQLPLSAPQVFYTDGQLTITAEHSTLTDILAAIRAQVGAEIDAPPSASREHMVVRLGPGPARDVIASLLSWTDYDYVIQASDEDPAGVKSVLVSSRPKTATGSGSAAPPVQMARHSPYSRVPEPISAPLAASPAEAPADDPVPIAPDKPAEAVADQQVPQSEAKSEPTGQQIATVDTQMPLGVVRKSDLANTMTAADTAALEVQAAALAQQEHPPAQDSNSSDPESKHEGMIQQLQHMYQQRIQIQKPDSPSN